MGIVQLIDPQAEESHYWGDIESGLRAIDIWIGEESDLGHGLGTQMMRQAFDRCFADTPGSPRSRTSLAEEMARRDPNCVADRPFP